MKRLIRCLAVVVGLAWSANDFAQEVKSELEPWDLRFTLTVKNPADVPRLITNIGVTSNYHPNYLCLSPGAETLPVIADYRIKFHLLTEETTVSADPPLRIPPHDFARFTVSIATSLMGICDDSVVAKVAVFAVFDDNSRVTTRTVDLSLEQLKV